MTRRQSFLGQTGDPGPKLGSKPAATIPAGRLHLPHEGYHLHTTTGDVGLFKPISIVQCLLPGQIRSKEPDLQGHVCLSLLP